MSPPPRVQLINNGNVGITKLDLADPSRFTLTLQNAELPHAAAAEELASQIMAGKQAAHMGAALPIASQENAAGLRPAGGKRRKA